MQLHATLAEGANRRFTRGKLAFALDDLEVVSTSDSPPTRCLTGAALPSGIRDLNSPPTHLYLTGSLAPGPRVAIVGTRRPTPEAERFTQDLAFELARAGVVVVSGGALGIDTAAHEGALRAGGGTLVVAPASYCRPYPEENRFLFGEIVQRGGGYLSLYSEPTVAKPHAFFARNALLVSLSVCVILVQAPYRSGARNASLWARRMGRPYWVVPHAPWCAPGASCVAELRLGGMPLVSAKDVLTWLGQRGQHSVPVAEVHVDLSEETETARAARTRPSKLAGKLGGWRPAAPREEETERVSQRDAGPHRDVCRLLAQLETGPKHLDQLCAELGWHAGHLQSTVLHATLLGEVTRLASGQVSATPRAR